jgi:cysteine desulfuration protein SufE
MDALTQPSIETILEDFSFLEEWDDRYRYLIELGRRLAPLPEAAHNAANKVNGCASQVWLQTDIRAGAGGKRLDFMGDSDALIVKGLVAVAIAIFSGKSPAEIEAIDAEAVFDRLGLAGHLSTQRSNGLRALVQRMKAEARAERARA